MKLQHLKYIVEIADCKSITKASKKLFVSQPYLSKIVSDIEKQMKKKLFVRHNQGLELTPHGHQAYLLARSVIRQMELLNHLGKENVENEETVKLSVSVSNLIVKESLLLDYFTKGSAARHEFDLNETTIRGCIENTEKGVSDFAVIVLDDYQRELLDSLMEQKGLEFVELDRGYRYYHLHKDHPLANHDKISVESLSNYPFVRLKMDDFAMVSSEKYKEEYPDVQVDKCIVVNHYHSYLSIVKNNGAFMIGNQWQISELEKMGIKSIRFSSLKHKVYLGILKKQGDILSEEAKKFIQLFKESYGFEERI